MSVSVCVSVRRRAVFLIRSLHCDTARAVAVVAVIKCRISPWQHGRYAPRSARDQSLCNPRSEPRGLRRGRRRGIIFLPENEDTAV